MRSVHAQNQSGRRVLWQRQRRPENWGPKLTAQPSAAARPPHIVVRLRLTLLECLLSRITFELEQQPNTWPVAPPVTESNTFLADPRPSEESKWRAPPSVLPSGNMLIEDAKQVPDNAHTPSVFSVLKKIRTLETDDDTHPTDCKRSRCLCCFAHRVAPATSLAVPLARLLRLVRILLLPQPSRTRKTFIVKMPGSAPRGEAYQVTTFCWLDPLSHSRIGCEWPARKS